MFALTRAAQKHAFQLTSTRLIARSFAEVVSTSTGTTADAEPFVPSETTKLEQARVLKIRPGQHLSKGRIPVREDHGLYAFFRKKDDPELVGDARFEVVETPEKAQRATGRGWRASELRLKSFEDLHILWYILLRERNLLATQKEEARRMGVTHTGTQVSLNRVHQCRKSMARIKAVINERRLAYEGAVQLIEKERNKHHNELVMQHQVTEQLKERKYLQQRRLFMERRREARRLRREANERAALLNQARKAAATSPVVEEIQDEAPVLVNVETISKDKPKTPKKTRTVELHIKTKDPKVQPETQSAPTTPVDAAAAGLFGNIETMKGQQRP